MSWDAIGAIAEVVAAVPIVSLVTFTARTRVQGEPNSLGHPPQSGIRSVQWTDGAYCCKWRSSASGLKCYLSRSESTFPLFGVHEPTLFVNLVSLEAK